MSLHELLLTLIGETVHPKLVAMIQKLKNENNVLPSSYVFLIIEWSKIIFSEVIATKGISRAQTNLSNSMKIEQNSSMRISTNSFRTSKG